MSMWMIFRVGCIESTVSDLNTYSLTALMLNRLPYGPVTRMSVMFSRLILFNFFNQLLVSFGNVWKYLTLTGTIWAQFGSSR